MRFTGRAFVAALAVLMYGMIAPLWAQSPMADSVMSGVVTDPSGAELPAARLHLHGVPAGSGSHQIKTDATGHFSIVLPPATYDITVEALGFESYQRRNVVLVSGEHLDFVFRLHIATHTEQVVVPAEGASATDPSENRTALVFKNEELSLLSDDNATLQRQLAAIAGSDDENGAQIFVDGFSGGRFPPKSSIREVRINQNPFSAQYDRRGFGRIEVFTKPGSDKYHGYFEVSGNNDSFNARNPCRPVCGQPATTGDQPPYHSVALEGNVSGPMGKRTSFFLSANRFDQENNAIVNASVLNTGDVTLPIVPFSAAIPNPSVTNTVSLRLDRQLTTNNTFTARYERNAAHTGNAGLNSLTLPSAAYSSNILTQTLQVGNTQIVNPKVVSETRFQYIRTRTGQVPVSSAPSLIVQGAFNGGGSNAQTYTDNQDRYEFQEYLSFDHGTHFLRAGVRYRLLRDANFSQGNYNGQFTFPDINTYRRTLLAIQSGNAMFNTGYAQPSQFNITQGQPSAALLTGDAGVYFEDDWKLRKSLTLSAGVRLETQTAIPDHFDPAPRLSLAWSIKPPKAKAPLIVLRSGFAVFYDRFGPGNLLQAVRQNGTTQQAFFLQKPAFYSTNTADALSALQSSSSAAVQPTVYRVAPDLRSQYDIIASISGEHAFRKGGNVSLGYTNYRGVHQFLSRNINAPFPGTYDPDVPTSGIRPLGGTQNIYQYSSSGYSRGQTFSGNLNLSPAKGVFLFGFFAVQKRNTDAGGPSAFASNQYNISVDYGRSGFTTTKRVFFGGQWNMPLGFSISSFVSAHSGVPFNITIGQDVNGDTLYNDRPAFATDLTRPSVRQTSFGNFDTSPLSSQAIIPINFGHSPAYAAWQGYVRKSFRLGPLPKAVAPQSAKSAAAAGKRERPLELNFAAEVQNVLNHVNPGTPIGVLSSRYFGQSLSLADSFNTGAANRTLTLHCYIEF